MADLVSYLAAAVVLVAAILKYRSIRPARPTVAQRHQLVALAAFAPAHALAIPQTQAVTAQIDPVPYTTNFVSHTAAMVAGNCLVFMLAHVLDDPVSAIIRSRWRAAVAVLVAAVLVMAVLLVLSGVELGSDFLTVSAEHPELVGYQLVFLGFMTICAGRLILLLRRYLSRPVRPLMRWGMRGVVLGCSVGLGYIAWTVATMVVTFAGGQLVSRPVVVAEVLGAISVTFMAVGSTLSAFAWLPTMIRRWRVRWVLHAVTPLWRMLAAIHPHVTFHQADLTDPEDALYRRVIEIRDVQMALTCYIPSAVAAEALAGIEDADGGSLGRDAVRAEAVVMAVGIESYRAGCSPADAVVSSDTTTADADAVVQAGRHILVEARRLIRVYAALRHDPVVAHRVRAAQADLAVGASRPQARRGDDTVAAPVAGVASTAWHTIWADMTDA